MASVLRFCLVAPRRIQISLGPHFARASACADGPDSAESEKKVDVRTNCFNPEPLRPPPHPLRGVKFGLGPSARPGSDPGGNGKFGVGASTSEDH